MFIRTRLFFCFLAVLLLAVGCGDDDTSQPTADTAADQANDAPDVITDLTDATPDVPSDAPSDADVVVPLDIAISGLSAPVEASFDEHGVLHLVCATDDDCFAAQGYYHAAHRFFTMDLGRRQVKGTLSTLVGGVGIDSDVYHRALMATPQGEPLWDVAWTNAKPRTKQTVEAYTRGVNAWLADMRAGRNGATLTAAYNIPFVHGENIPDWEPTDSMAIMLSMVEMLSLDFDLDLKRGEALAALPLETAWDLLGLRPATSAGIMPAAGIGLVKLPFDLDGLRSAKLRLESARDVLRASRERIESIPWRISHYENDLGSNNWVLGPQRTAGDESLLANDPHLGLTNPAIWYWVELDSMSRGTGSLHAAGASIPAAPGVVIGHNEQVAWGVTTASLDLSDVYLETLSSDGQGVVFEGADVPFVRSEQTIEVTNGTPVTATLEWVPHHGPVIAKDEATGMATTLKWAAHAGVSDLDTFVELNFAANVSEALAAIELASVANQCFVVTDRSGTIAWSPYSHVPQRPWVTSDLGPWIPLPGDGSAEWGDWIPAAQMPKMIDPPKGFVATANHDIDGGLSDGNPANDGHDVYQTYVAAGYRGQRIVDLIEAGGDTHDLASMIEIQGDVYSLFGARIVPAILTAADATASAQTPAAVKVADALRAWDFQCPTGLATSDPAGALDGSASVAASSIGCSAFHALVFALIDAAFGDELAQGGFSLHKAAIMNSLTHLLTDSASLLTGEALWDDTTTTGTVETRDDIVAIALDAAGTRLAELMGDDPNGWRWGRVHTLTLKNHVLASVTSLNLGPFATSGGMGTVDVAAPGRNFDFSHGPSLRMVNRVGASGIESWVQFPGGQDLHLASPHHADWVDRWLANLPVKLLFERAEIDGANLEVITLHAP